MSHVTYSVFIDFLTELGEAAFNASREAIKAHQSEKRRRSALSRNALKPGSETPLWNEMKNRLQFHTSKHGSKAILARELGLPRQRIHQFLREGSAMSDAERTLLLLTWLINQENQTNS